jgi:hypothetical protein
VLAPPFFAQTMQAITKLPSIPAATKEDEVDQQERDDRRACAIIMVSSSHKRSPYGWSIRRPERVDTMSHLLMAPRIKTRRVAVIHWPESAYAVDRLRVRWGPSNGERQIEVAGRGAGVIEDARAD